MAAKERKERRKNGHFFVFSAIFCGNSGSSARGSNEPGPDDRAYRIGPGEAQGNVHVPEATSAALFRV